MNKLPVLSNHKTSQKGSVLALFAISLVLLISLAAITIDVGYLFVGRNELQNAADAAALGATRQLGVIYKGITNPSAQRTYNVDTENRWTEDDANYTIDRDTIIHVAKESSSNNEATNKSIIINDTDIEIGVWTSGTFTAQNIRPTAVKVTTHRRTGDVSGPVATFFSAIFGPDSFPLSANATASLGAKSSATEGELELPIGISRKWFNDPDHPFQCGDVVKFSPTNDPEACAGWTTFKYDPANDQKVRKILLPEDDSNHLVSPENDDDDSFEFVNGDLSEGTFENLLAEYQRKGFDVDKVHDPVDLAEYTGERENYDWPEYIEDETGPLPGYEDFRVPLCNYNSAIVACNEGDETTSEADPGLQLRYPSCQGASGCTGDLRYAHEWETTIIVYDSDDCTPNGTVPILGYAPVTVFNVGYPSYKVVQARIECAIIDNEDNRGGGSDFGILGNIPGLVE